MYSKSMQNVGRKGSGFKIKSPQSTAAYSQTISSYIISELKKFAPEILNYCKIALEKDIEDLDFLRLETESFKKCPKIAVTLKLKFFKRPSKVSFRI